MTGAPFSCHPVYPLGFIRAHESVSLPAPFFQPVFRIFPLLPFCINQLFVLELPYDELLCFLHARTPYETLGNSSILLDDKKGENVLHEIVKMFFCLG